MKYNSWMVTNPYFPGELISELFPENVNGRTIISKNLNDTRIVGISINICLDA